MKRTVTRYVVNTNTDNDWCEICDQHDKHINGIGTPVARFVDADQAKYCTWILNLWSSTLNKATFLVDKRGAEVTGLVLRTPLRRTVIDGTDSVTEHVSD